MTFRADLSANPTHLSPMGQDNTGDSSKLRRPKNAAASHPRSRSAENARNAATAAGPPSLARIRKESLIIRTLKRNVRLRILRARSPEAVALCFEPKLASCRDSDFDRACHLPPA